MPLRTTQIDLRTEDPRSPDVRVGKIFDRNWELLSFLVPMVLVQGVVKKHFERKTADVVFTNLSRLASQWEGIVTGTLSALEKESMRRLDGLVATIERLIASAGTVLNPSGPRYAAAKGEAAEGWVESAMTGSGLFFTGGRPPCPRILPRFPTPPRFEGTG